MAASSNLTVLTTCEVAQAMVLSGRVWYECPNEAIRAAFHECYSENLAMTDYDYGISLNRVIGFVREVLGEERHSPCGMGLVWVPHDHSAFGCEDCAFYNYFDTGSDEEAAEQADMVREMAVDRYYDRANTYGSYWRRVGLGDDDIYILLRELSDGEYVTFQEGEISDEEMLSLLRARLQVRLRRISVAQAARAHIEELQRRRAEHEDSRRVRSYEEDMRTRISDVPTPNTPTTSADEGDSQSRLEMVYRRALSVTVRPPTRSELATHDQEENVSD